MANKPKRFLFDRNKTFNGVVYESYQPNQGSGEVPFLIFSGLNVSPGLLIPRECSLEENYFLLRESSYFGVFPALLAQKSGQEVFIVYQPGTSNGLKRGLYSEKTKQAQFLAGLRLAGKRQFYPLTHSLSTDLGLDLVLNSGLGSLKQFLPGTISSVMTTAEDALCTEKGPRKLGFIEWIDLFRLAKKIRLSLPFYYPLGNQFWHDGSGEEEKNPAWSVSKWINTLSADYALKIDSFKKSKDGCSLKKPLGLVTLEDRIFSPQLQAEIYHNLGAEIVEIRSGHRWFTSPLEKLNPVLEKIIDHYQRSLAD